MTLTYFMASTNRSQLHDSENIYNMIQWQTETLHKQGLVVFYESTMLESIKNAVGKFVSMGVLDIKKVQIKRNTFKTYYKFSEKFEKDSDLALKFYNTVLSYQPHQSQNESDRVFNEIRRLTISDIPISGIAKL